MHINVVAGEDAPIDLLTVVIEMVVAVPCAADIAVRPVREKSWRVFVLSYTTCQEILVVIPDTFEFLVENTYRRSGPELPPARFGTSLQIIDRKFRAIGDTSVCERQRIQLGVRYPC